MRSQVRLPDPEKQLDISPEEFKINSDITAENFKISFLEELTVANKKFETDILISVLDEIMQHIISLNKNQPPPQLTCFCSYEIPKISVKDYLTRLTLYLRATAPELAIIFIYLSRYQSAHPNNLITEFNIHRLLITALVLAQKFHADDIIHKNTYSAKVGGITLKEMNKLEIEFLIAIDHKLYVTSEEYNQWKNILNISPPFKETTERGANAPDPTAHYHFDFSFFTPRKPAPTPHSENDMVDVPPAIMTRYV
ncbi:MAG: hypothetical protein P4M12_11935 [Gammaproteobacteria bacterium]|nr:hypothetical protein [Gammaproteobacteria bacterium]